MELIVIIFFIALFIGIHFKQNEHHREEINRQIECLGGRVISIERHIFSSGPFATVYHIKYKIGDEVEEGWVRFGGLVAGIFGPNWKL